MKSNNIISISAKCSDMFSATLKRDGSKIGEYEGYVPGFFPGGDNDYVTLNIDINTGQIVNWHKPTAGDLQIFFK